jgi:ABC-2 type transport system permease protein
MNPYALWISYKTITKKEVTRFLRVWSQTLLPPVVTMSLYFVIFGKFIGSQIQNINGFSYMEFIVPGLVMMAVITSSFMNTVSSFYMAKFQRTVEELMVSPTPYFVVILGYVTGGVLRGLLTGAIVLSVALFFTHIAIHNILFTLLFVVLTSIIFSLAGLINGVLATSFDGISIVPTFVLTPLTYLGGVFYSIQALPPVWQKVSLFNPILYMVNGFRYGFMGVTDVNLTLSVSILLAFIAIFFGITWWLFKTGRGLRN